jgi:hypothetical protein
MLLEVAVPLKIFIGYGLLILLINVGIAIGERLYALRYRRINGLIMFTSAAVCLWSLINGNNGAALIAGSLSGTFLVAVWRGCEVENEIDGN